MDFSPRWKKILEVAAQHNLPKYRLKQISENLYSTKRTEWLHFESIPKPVRFALHEKFEGNLLSVKPVEERIGEHAHKVLFETHDGQRIEAVSLDFKTHRSVCISSQAGCAFNCSFCATGKLGLSRQLTVDEITDQVLYFQQKGHNVNTVSFMGMGEPLANPRVYNALHLFNDEEAFNMSPRRFNVSTIGVLPGIKKLTEEHPQVNLAFSLHSPFNEQRTELMPSNRLYPLEDVMELCEERIKRTGRRIFLAYLLLENRNDSLEHANAVIDLIQRRHESVRHLFHVNLLPYNRAFNVSDDFQRLAEDKVLQFEKTLMKNKVSVSYRNSFGHSIEAACGQLRAGYEEKLIKGPLLGQPRNQPEKKPESCGTPKPFVPGKQQRLPREKWEETATQKA